MQVGTDCPGLSEREMSGGAAYLQRKQLLQICGFARFICFYLHNPKKIANIAN